MIASTSMSHATRCCWLMVNSLVLHCGHIEHCAQHPYGKNFEKLAQLPIVTRTKTWPMLPAHH